MSFSLPGIGLLVGFSCLLLEGWVAGGLTSAGFSMASERTFAARVDLVIPEQIGNNPYFELEAEISHNLE